tara:strand:- start:338 stop:535 length:198 start_codon:yes stop_codon:yes gene_type:complete
MLKVELVKYPIEITIVDKLVLFMIYHYIDTIDSLIKMKDKDIEELEGFEPSILEAIHIIRGIELN